MALTTGQCPRNSAQIYRSWSASLPGVGRGCFPSGRSSLPSVLLGPCAHVSEEVSGMTLRVFIPAVAIRTRSAVASAVSLVPLMVVWTFPR